MTDVGFKRYTPPPRYPPVTDPWTRARIEEAPDVAGAPGAWTVIDTIDLAPLDTQPQDPQPRSFTTESATLQEGWYRITWLDAAGDPSQPTPAVHNTIAPTYRPRIEEVAALLHARTAAGGVEVGTFRDETTPGADDQTSPTASQVEELIDGAVADIEARLGKIPDAYAEEARRLAALQTASLVEASYFPGELDTDRSAYRQYQAQYLNGVEALARRLASPGALRLV